MNMHWIRSLVALASGCLAAGDITDPGPTWLYPAMTNVQAHWRPGLGLPGEAAPGRPMLDLATQQITITTLGIRTWSDKLRTPDLTADEERTAFWTETLVPVPGGGVLGFDAYDLREGLAVKGPDGRRGTWESPAGIRFGGAWDLLYPFQPTHWASLGLEAWVPAWSQGETSLRAGLRLGSNLRMELGVGWHPTGVQARQDSTFTGWQDTLEISGLRRTWDGRLALRIDSVQFQVWGGWRTIDPRGREELWRPSGQIAFGGIQTQGRVAGLSIDAQARMEGGQERFEILRDGLLRGSALERSSLGTSLQIEPWSAWASGQPRLVLEYTRLVSRETWRGADGDGWLAAVAAVPGLAGTSTVSRGGIIGQWAFFWSAFRLAPELGWHRIHRKGPAAPLWFGGMGDLAISGGSADEAVWVPGAEVSWKRSGSIWNYHLTHPIDVSDRLSLGWRHDILLSQSF